MDRDPRRSTSGVREWALAGLVGASLVVPPWCLGGMNWWPGQWLLVAGCFVTLGWALVPLPRPWQATPERWAALLRFPPLVPGLLLLALMAVQTGNPSMAYVETPRGLWPYRMDPLPAESWIGWLPSGVRTPFRWMDGWRQLLLVGAALALSAAVWMGLTRRAAALTLLGLAGVNGAALALLDIFQRLTGAKQILWQFEPLHPFFAATFFYRNHASAFLNLSACAAFAVGFVLSRQARRRGAKSHPGVLFWLLGGLTLVTSMTTGSRGGAAIAAVLLLLAGILILREIWIEGPAAWILAGLLLLAGGGAGWAYRQQVADFFAPTWERLQPGKRDASAVDRALRDFSGSRARLVAATLEMAEDRPWFGWGAGSFRYIFPRYQMRDPQLRGITAPDLRRAEDRRMPWQRRGQSNLYDHAHCDWVQYLAEWGRVGMGLVVIGLGAMAWAGLSRWAFWRPEQWMLLAGLVGTMAHAAGDFILSNPAILALFGVLATISVWLLRHRARLSEESGP